MELVYFVMLIMWSVSAYFIAKGVKKNHPSFNIEPIMYGVGAFLIGFIWVMFFLAIKFAIWNSKQNN